MPFFGFERRDRFFVMTLEEDGFSPLNSNFSPFNSKEKEEDALNSKEKEDADSIKQMI